MKKGIVILIILAVVAVAGLGISKLVGTFKKAGALGDAAVAQFHERYNAGKDAEIVEHAAKGFKEVTPVEGLQELNNRLRKAAGNFQSASRGNLNLSNSNGNKTLAVSYDSKFEKAQIKEKFVFDYNGSEPLLLSYSFEAQ